jgi:hypothetical protein
LIGTCEADLVDEDMSDRALTADFDHDPERFAANQLATESFSMIGDVHDRVADRLAEIAIGPFSILVAATALWRLR